MTSIYYTEEGNLSLLKDKIIAIIGYGNQARAQALNLQDSGLQVIIGPQNDIYKQRAKNDGFSIGEIPEIIEKSDILFLLVSDDDMVRIFNDQVKPYLKDKHTLVFGSGYTVAYDMISPPKNVDVILISPRVPGIVIRESFITKKGYYSFVGIYQDFTGLAKETLLALVRGIGGLIKPAIEVTFKQQAVLSLFVTQTFTYALTQVLMRSILRLIEDGYPPEAIFIELILSGEGGYTVDKIIDVGMIRQMNFHSQTSQYGQMTRGMKFQKVAKEVEEIQRVILKEIEDGRFTKEWKKDESKLRLRIMRYLESKTKFASIEQEVRDTLGFKKSIIAEKLSFPPETEINKYPSLKEELEEMKEFYDEL
ncbi:MAG: NAD(P)-binding domain-containing protein [Promethearchaeota archaeon]